MVNRTIFALLPLVVFIKPVSVFRVMWSRKLMSPSAQHILGLHYNEIY